MTTREGTPHIAPKGAPIAKTILLPGDPLRARFIADTFLDDVAQFNAVRGALGYTGSFEGTPVSVMGTGMGIPSISLYAYELVTVFGCQRLIRVGSCGALRPDIGLYEIVAAQAASTDSNFMAQYALPGTFAPTGSFRLLHDVYGEATRRGVGLHVGNIVSTDVFYSADATALKKWADMGVVAVEMETAGLYAVAARAGVEALGIFTVSDNVVTGEKMTPSQRETGFSTMVELALPLAALD